MGSPPKRFVIHTSDVGIIYELLLWSKGISSSVCDSTCDSHTAHYSPRIKSFVLNTLLSASSCTEEEALEYWSDPCVQAYSGGVGIQPQFLPDYEGEISPSAFHT